METVPATLPPKMEACAEQIKSEPDTTPISSIKVEPSTAGAADEAAAPPKSEYAQKQRRLYSIPIMELLYEQKGNVVVEETSINGGGKVIHIYPDNWTGLNASEQDTFVKKCYDMVFRESTPGSPDYVMGIVHAGASDVPNVLRFVCDRYPRTEVSVEPFGQKHMCEVRSIQSFVEQVDRTYQCGTHRAGTMRNISLVGCQQEERGGFFADVLRLLEAHPFLGDVLPWGPRAVYDHLDPGDSDDGPILWCCPGEQMVPLQELSSAAGGTSSASGTPSRKRTALDRLHILPRNERPREKLIEDRTGAHADMAGLFPTRHPVAAAGFVQGATDDAQGRELKDIIAFHGGDMDLVAKECGLYFHEEPKDQLLDPQLWLDEAKLNQLRRFGIRYARIRLVGGDVYFIPRKVVHQFRTIGACISVTWHLKHRDYYVDNQPTEALSATGTIGHVDEATSASEAERGVSPAPTKPAKKIIKAAAARRLAKGDRKPTTASPRKGGGKPPRRKRHSSDDDEDDDDSSDSFEESSGEEVVMSPTPKRVKRSAPAKKPEDLDDSFLLEDSSELEESD